jgi:tRNA (guanosine-2'-O-)-methyltransferase
VALGSTKWLNLTKYNEEENNTLHCFDSLRDQGYRIVASTPHQDDILLDELDLDQKTALVFGTELEGLSEVAIKHADAFVKIPMYGFTESFNISVSAAICIHHLTEKLRSSDIQWQLTEAEMIETRILWAKSIVKHPDKHEKAFLKRAGLD